MRITWQRLNRCGCIPRIAKVVEPFAIARVRDGDMLADVGRLVCVRWVSQLLPMQRTAMTCTHFAKEQVLFREGDPADSVFRLLSGSVDILRELDGDPILLGTVGAGQFIGEMGVVENRPPQCDGSSRQRDRDRNPHAD